MPHIEGKVIRGQNRGKQLGYPTANVLVPQDIQQGIYISLLTFANDPYPALTFVGDAKTFGENTVQAETYILDFDADIYDQEVRIELVEKIRDNMKFTSVDELIKQMDNDRQVAENYFRSRGLL